MPWRSIGCAGDQKRTLSAAEARQLLRVREHTGMQVGEAFMVRTHPQWIGVKKLKQVGPPERAIEQGREIPKALRGQA